MHNDSDLIAKHIAAHGVTRIAAHEGTAPDDEPSDYELHIKIKNGRILAAMRRAGIKTITELSERAGVSQVELSKLINIRRPAFNAKRINKSGAVAAGSGGWSRGYQQPSLAVSWAIRAWSWPVFRPMAEGTSTLGLNTPRTLRTTATRITRPYGNGCATTTSKDGSRA